MENRIDLRKWNFEGTQRRCNVCAEFFPLEKLNSNYKCKPCNTKAKKAWVEGTTEEFNNFIKSKKLIIEQEYLTVGLKKCNTCFKIKPFLDFYIESNSWDGLQNKCKSCTEIYNKNSKPYSKESNKKQRNKRQRERYSEDLEFKLTLTLRNMMNRLLQKKEDDNKIELLGCSIKEWVIYLENKFDENMNWENYGKGRYWEIDHIIPLSKGGSFHYTNTQPLSIKENQQKGNRI
jgi:5-methylcytosine-specific restriction endonuclease McrA